MVVCGLAAEARIARGDANVHVIAGGGDRGRLFAELEATITGAAGFLSFGLAGGLAPDLRPGDIRVAEAVIASDGVRYAADERWGVALARRLAVPQALFAGVDAPLADAAGKTALREMTGAATVDMETHLVAACAKTAGLPFAAIRVVTDPAHRSLPHAATVGMRADGKIDLAALLATLAKNPAQLPGLIRTGREARAAFASLLRCRQLLGPGFAFLDLVEPLLHVP